MELFKKECWRIAKKKSFFLSKIVHIYFGLCNFYFRLSHLINDLKHIVRYLHIYYANIHFSVNLLWAILCQLHFYTREILVAFRHHHYRSSFLILFHLSFLIVLHLQLHFSLHRHHYRSPF